MADCRPAGIESSVIKARQPQVRSRRRGRPSRHAVRNNDDDDRLGLLGPSSSSLAAAAHWFFDCPLIWRRLRVSYSPTSAELIDKTVTKARTIAAVGDLCALANHVAMPPASAMTKPRTSSVMARRVRVRDSNLLTRLTSRAKSSLLGPLDEVRVTMMIVLPCSAVWMMLGPGA